MRKNLIHQGKGNLVMGDERRSIGNSYAEVTRGHIQGKVNPKHEVGGTIPKLFMLKRLLDFRRFLWVLWIILG